MHDRKIGCLPVVDDAGMLVGLITETDLLRAIVEILGYKEHGTRIASLSSMPDRPDAWRELVRFLQDFEMDVPSLMTYPLHARPGYRDVVIRVKGEQAEALAGGLKAKYGESVSILVT